MNELLANIRQWFWLIVAVLALLLSGGIAWTFWSLGGKTQEVKAATAETKAVVTSANKANAKVRTDLGRAASTGQAREQDRARLDQFFDQLDREASHAPSAATDRYVLPDDRLRLWRDANAGRPTSGESAGQPDGSAAAAASTGLGRDTGAGNEPPAGGEALPPARVPDVPAAGVPAATNGEL